VTRGRHAAVTGISHGRRGGDAGGAHDRGMATIAHLTDLHLVEEEHAARRGADRLRLGWLTLGLPVNAGRRRRRALVGLTEARRSGADHLVVTGDLTEDGVDAQFALLAAVLAESGWDPARVTLVPGNHDLYADGRAWERALSGPLRAFAPTSAAGAAVALPGAVVVAVSTAVPQRIPRSAGALDGRQLARVAELARETRQSGRALVLAQHHPPLAHPVPGWQWVDGLREHGALGEILRGFDHAHVLHGHTHRAADRPVRAGASIRIFSAESTAHGAAPLRLYRARHGRLWAEPAAERMHAAAFALA